MSFEYLKPPSEEHRRRLEEIGLLRMQWDLLLEEIENRTDALIKDLRKDGVIR